MLMPVQSVFPHAGVVVNRGEVSTPRFGEWDYGVFHLDIPESENRNNDADCVTLLSHPSYILHRMEASPNHNLLKTGDLSYPSLDNMLETLFYSKIKSGNAAEKYRQFMHQCMNLETRVPRTPMVDPILRIHSSTNDNNDDPGSKYDDDSVIMFKKRLRSSSSSSAEEEPRQATLFPEESSAAEDNNDPDVQESNMEDSDEVDDGDESESEEDIEEVHFSKKRRLQKGSKGLLSKASKVNSRLTLSDEMGDADDDVVATSGKVVATFCPLVSDKDDPRFAALEKINKDISPALNKYVEDLLAEILLQLKSRRDISTLSQQLNQQLLALLEENGIEADLQTRYLNRTYVGILATVCEYFYFFSRKLCFPYS